ncbi:MAG TPA: NAD(P)H-hydrate dehydratase [Terriglobia bacterium]|nr:NAD(P)H-hydrate dehydratase [Terriglobia bacterium]
MKILNASEMQRIDRLTTERYGVPSLTLMENAGQGVVDFLARRYSPLENHRIAIVCGRGNNGGDGLVIARLLRQRLLKPRVLLLADPATMRGDAATNLRRLETSGPPEIVASPEAWREVYPTLEGASLLVDALLGTGLTRPLQGFLVEVVRDLNRLSPAPAVVAVDLPSGLSADTGSVIGECIRADASVTFTAPKRAHVLPPACERVGEFVVHDIGTPRDAIESDDSVKLNLTTTADLAWIAKPRPPDSHKGNFGHVLVIAGSVGKTGAAAMSALAALRAGAGLVTVATPKSALPIVAARGLEFMTAPLPETESGNIALQALDDKLMEQLLAGKSLIAIGPGIGPAPETAEFVRELVRETDLPMVIDADGLNGLAGSLKCLAGRGRIRVLTPHPGEMSRLAGRSTAEVQSARLEVATSFAVEHHVHLVLKGFRTLVADPGGAVWVNPTGNPGMAKGGTGDVLTGLIAGFLAEFHERPVTEAVAAAVYLHGLAGDLATAEVGEISMLAGDLLERIPDALRNLTTPPESDARRENPPVREPVREEVY